MSATRTKKTKRTTAQYSKTKKKRHTPLHIPPIPVPAPPQSTTSETKRVVIKTNYRPEDDERYIPIPSYTPKLLPEYSPDKYECFYYRIRQTETKDTFIATVRKRGISDIEIIVGGSVKSLPKECVKIVIQNHREIDMVDAIFLVDYRQRCNEANDLKSAIILARVAVSFAYTYFRIDKFILKDHSMFYCYTPERRYEFSLAGRYLLKYGKTWYQHNLNARIYHPLTLEGIQKYLSFVETKPEFTTFIMTSDGLDDTNRERLKLIWMKARNYREMVLHILDEIHRLDNTSRVSENDENINRNCKLLFPWFNRISDEYLHELLYADNFIMRDGFSFVDGLEVEYLGTDNTLRKDTELMGTFIKNNQKMRRVGGGGNNSNRWFVKRD